MFSIVVTPEVSHALMSSLKDAAHCQQSGHPLLPNAQNNRDMSVTTLEDTTRTMRRVLGGAHPATTGIETSLRLARAALLRARETPSTGTA
jgi:hypothetical protein